jgi:hypothetical protein
MSKKHTPKNRETIEQSMDAFKKAKLRPTTTKNKVIKIPTRKP